MSLKLLTVAVLLSLFIGGGIPAAAQNLSVPGLDFDEFGAEVSDDDRARAAYYMGRFAAGNRLHDSGLRGEDYHLKYDAIRRESGDSLLVLDNYGLCEAMCGLMKKYDYYMRPWDLRNGQSETPAIQRLYAYGIQNARNRTDFIRFLSGYMVRASYPDQKIVGEYLIRECGDLLDDGSKCDALEYAATGILETVELTDTAAVRTAYGYYVNLLALSLKISGEDDQRPLNILWRCAWLAHTPHVNDWDMVERLYGHYRKSGEPYLDGRIKDIFSDPLYGLFMKKIDEGDYYAASDVLDVLMSGTDVDLSESNCGNAEVSLYSDAQIYLLYNKAVLDYKMGRDGYAEEMRRAWNLGMKYLSPEGGYYGIPEYIRPDYRFLTGIIQSMPTSYLSSDAGEVYDAALFIKGTTENLGPDILKRLEELGEKDLCEYADSLRNNYDRGSIWRTGPNPIYDVDEAAFRRWSEREKRYEGRLRSIFGPEGAMKLWEKNVVDWRSVRNALGDDETAIEIVRTLSSSGELYEYRALVLNRNDDVPTEVKLCTATELREILRSGNIYDTDSRKMFESVWKPICPHIKGKIIHYSPFGILANVNIAAVCGEDGRRLSDSYDIRRCSSTGWLAGRDATETPAKYGSIELWGGSRSISESAQEIEDIGRIAAENGVSPAIHAEAECTEQSFRNISRKHVPILHIAAHGFYDRPDSGSCGNEEDNPLDRCGILLEEDASEGGVSGTAENTGTDEMVWKPGKVSMNRIDGVLRGSEIARMNLVGTDLVVLSSCKSGLGDFSEEGIMGLRRAFRLAGAKTVVVALGNVQDKATRVFMTEFYRSLFSGKTKRRAFSDAVTFMKSSSGFSSPECWAQFVMID